MTGRPRLTRSEDCETCHWYHCAVCRRRLDAMTYAERQPIASHFMEHRRLDRRRETYLRYDRKRRGVPAPDKAA